MQSLDIVKDYCRKHPDTGHRTIARYLFKRHPGVFASANAVEMQVRRLRKKAGDRARKEREKAEKKGAEKFEFQIPRGSMKRKKTEKLRDPGKWAILGDLHIPYHDSRAIEAAVKKAYDSKAEHLLLNGDILDAYQNSRWAKDPKMRSVDKEIEMAKEIIAQIAKHFPGRKVYKIGNHEDRIEAYLFDNAPRMVGISKWDLGETLQKELGLDDWTMIASKQLYKLGKLSGYHGHELPRGLTNPVSVARGVWLRTQQTGFTNHWHSTSTHVETNGEKSRTWVCFSIGCLCDLFPDYGPVNKWNHGFAMVDLDARGNWKEDNLRIVDGQVFG